MKGLFALALIVGAVTMVSARQAKPTLDSLAWMAGAGAGSAGGVKGRTVGFEFLRIEQQADRIVYLSMPNGRSPATPFPLKEVSGTRVVFENPTHGSVLALGAQQAPSLKIVVLEGEGAVNIIQQKTAVRPLVEVRDRNNLPVAGATVTFSIAGGGQGAAFAGGVQTLTVTTNAAGQAAASSLNALSSGAFQIQVQAAYQGQIATAAISQTNFATAAAAAQAGAGAGSGGTATGAAGGAAGGGGGVSATALAIVGAAVGGGALAATQVLGDKGEEFDVYNGSLSGQLVFVNVASVTTCTRTRSVTGSIKIQLTAGSATGKAEVQVQQPELSATGGCNPNSQVESFAMTDIAVTGGPTALTFTSSTQSPAANDPVTSNTVTFKGSLSGTTITGTLSIEMTQRGSPNTGSGGGSTTLQVTLQK